MGKPRIWGKTKYRKNEQGQDSCLTSVFPECFQFCLECINWKFSRALARVPIKNGHSQNTYFVHMYTYVHICVYVYICTHILYIYIHVYICTHMYTYVYMYTYVHICTKYRKNEQKTSEQRQSRYFVCMYACVNIYKI